jgi:hypothetical protein
MRAINRMHAAACRKVSRSAAAATKRRWRSSIGNGSFPLGSRGRRHYLRPPTIEHKRVPLMGRRDSTIRGHLTRPRLQCPSHRAVEVLSRTQTSDRAEPNTLESYGLPITILMAVSILSR